MTVAYARLCLSYVGAVCLRRGTAGLEDFSAEALADADTLALAARLSVIADGNPDPNAMHPVRVELDLADGRTLAMRCGRSPRQPCPPISADAARAKFDACGASAALWDAVGAIEASGKVRRMIAILSGLRKNKMRTVMPGIG